MHDQDGKAVRAARAQSAPGDLAPPGMTSVALDAWGRMLYRYAEPSDGTPTVYDAATGPDAAISVGDEVTALARDTVADMSPDTLAALYHDHRQSEEVR